MKNKNNSNKRYLEVIGARQNNLKNINVKIPHNNLTVITGLSGSGKSSLAFDTIYAEGQRRFVESLSSYARQFLERLNKPDVDSIAGLPPAIAIQQAQPSKNPRSTVGTITEIYDYLRLLFARIGTTICKKCGHVVKKDSPNSVVNELKQLDNGTRLYIMFELEDKDKKSKDYFEYLKESGIFRYIMNNSEEIYDLDDNLKPFSLDDKVYFLVDRITYDNDKDTITRLTDSIELAFKLSYGKIIIKNISNNSIYKFSSRYECSTCDILYQEPEPRLFSFNNPYGACHYCQGFGRTIGIDENLVIPDKNLSLSKGAIHPFRTPGFAEHQRALLKVASKKRIPIDRPVSTLTPEQLDFLWEGADEYLGINGFFAMLEEKSYKMHYRILISRYRGFTKCKACGGSRIRTSARQVFINKVNIPELIKMPLDKVLDFFKKIELNEYQWSIAKHVIKEISSRLELLVDIGLGYLTLDRLSHTLSGGEAQRINLSTALGSLLVGTLYVLDEPSIGMHPSDTEKLINILFKLRDLGNTIIVVEHDLDIIAKADYIIDLGPKSGENGGEIIFSGTPNELANCNTSITAQYLFNKKTINLPDRQLELSEKKITIINACENNLKIPKLEIPLGCIVVITGVSGSGKSTLVYDVIYNGLKKAKSGIDTANGYDEISGDYYVNYVEMIDQSPIGKSSRSTPVTYTKAFDYIRDLFASTQIAKQMGYKAGYFSFNVPGGRCEVCEGEGTVSVDMQFLPDVHLVCDACKGTRYRKEVKDVLYNNKSIIDVLNMTIDEAVDFFEASERIVSKLKPLQDVGLGYLKLGQPSTMLSGGEAQRLKMAPFLDSSSNSDTLFIFDEPTTGLHPEDISKLLDCFLRLKKKGNSLIIIEHNLYVIANADWIIDLGPGAGDKGGKVVATGSPSQIIKSKDSITGKVLKDFFLKFQKS